MVHFDDWWFATPAAGAYTMQIAFTNFAGRGTLTNFPVLVKLNTDNTANYTGFINNDGYELRFYTNSALTGMELNYEIESFDNTTNSFVWVQVPELTNNASIWASWGDAANTNQVAYTTNGAAWTEGYVAVYHLNATNASGLVVDSTANKFHMTSSVNPITQQEGIIGSSIYVTNDIITYAFSVDTVITNFTVEGLMRPAYSYTDGPHRGWFNNNSAGNDFQGIVGSTYGTNYGYNGISVGLHLGGIVVQDTWTYIAYTAEAAISKTIGFYDGYIDWEFTGTSVDNDFGRFEIGCNRGQSRFFVGREDEIRVSEVTRSSNWVWACYMNQGANHNEFAEYGTPILQ